MFFGSLPYLSFSCLSWLPSNAEWSYSKLTTTRLSYVRHYALVALVFVTLDTRIFPYYSIFALRILIFGVSSSKLPSKIGAWYLTTSYI